jgi:hypothetical protein
MTSLFLARRRAEEFAVAVDGGPRNDAPGDEVTRLLEVVGALRTHEPVAPRVDFAADLRVRLMREAETRLDPSSASLLLPARERGPRERRLVAVASAFVLIGGTTTMVAAAQDALPGEALYPVKRGLERAEAGLSFSDAGRGRDLLDQAGDRLREVEDLLATNGVGVAQVPVTLADFSTAAEEGSALMFDAYRDSADPRVVETVRLFAADGIGTLEAIAETAPADAHGELTRAALLLREIDAEAIALCGSCAPGLDEVTVPGIFLARAEVDRALELARSTDLGNDHPVVVSQDTVRRLREALASSTADATGSGTESGTEDDPTAPSATPLPSPTWEAGSWPSLLPGVDVGSADTNEQEGDLVDKTEEELDADLDAGLGGAVETILPDPEDEDTDLGLLD